MPPAWARGAQSRAPLRVPQTATWGGSFYWDFSSGLGTLNAI
jgi:hypothetical protein